MSTATEDWAKLTVSQLKAVCKDKKLTRYSKLGKAALIQKLVEHTSNFGSLSSTPAADALLPTIALPGFPINSTVGTNPEHVSAPPERRDGTSGICMEQNYSLLNGIRGNASGSEPTKPLAKHPNIDSTGSSVEHSTVSVNHGQSLSTGGPAPTGSKKRPFESESLNIPSKHHKPLVPPVPSDSAILHPVFKVPANPASRKSISALPVSLFCSGAVARSIDPELRIPPLPLLPSETKTAKRFVPPVVLKGGPAAVLGKTPRNTPPASADHASDICFLQYLDFPVVQAPPLKIIPLPPSLAQRKQLDWFAILLSGISIEQLKDCAQVSRLFRYGAYISAVHRLSRSFPGRRLDLVLSLYSPKMTNMWPYLKQRQEELSERQRIYCDSFLGRTLSQHGISDHLWTSPDNYKQAAIAVRFLLTRLFFSISIGAGTSGEGVVIDAQEIVAGEVWRITTRSSSSAEVLYVLEATCEVVGRPPLSSNQNALDQHPANRIPLRADWLTYIEGRMLQPSASGRIPSLLEHLKWTNHEEYERGISKLWLKRIQKDGELGVAKLLVAERYILASVVGNSVSGRWMSSSEMAQDFNGLPSRVTYSKPKAHIHLFLPAHHHIESLHFTSLGGGLLHPALAAVQTPAREYYILRDNGMQVGCEEEGVALVWRGLLGCDALGRPN